MDLKNAIQSSLYAGIVGDALGVPDEISVTAGQNLCEVKNMLGYGRFDQPEGTWSDDTSMMLCTMESLIRGYNIDDLGKTLCRWLYEGYCTPCGFAFDVGLTTFMALDSIYTDGKSARESGCNTADDNGNGALMRMLPAALYFHKLPLEQFLNTIHEISGITHSHARSKIGCGIYALLIRELLHNNTNKLTAYQQAIARAQDYYNAFEEFQIELHHYSRLLSGTLATLTHAEIEASGYIVRTLESGIWCFLNFNDTFDILRHAVELGRDTDTSAMIPGSFAGIVYGLKNIPAHWLDSLAQKENIDTRITAFVNNVTHDQLNQQ